MQETEPQRPDLGIETVSPSARLRVTYEQFPWLSEEELSVPTVEVRLKGMESSFRYGSIVDGNNAIEGIASDVSPEHSLTAERSMFRGLSMLLANERTTSVELVPYSSSTARIYKTTNVGPNAPRLFFGILYDNISSPVVLKLGIAPHKKQQRLIGILSGDNRHRLKKDG